VLDFLASSSTTTYAEQTLSPLQQPAAPIVPDNCNDHYLPNDNLAQWRQTKQVFIAKFFADLEDSGTDRKTLEMVAIESGVGLFRGRKLLSDYLSGSRKPRYTTADVRIATYDETSLVKTRLKANDLAGLFNDVREGRISPNVFFVSKSGLVFLLSYVLELKTDNQADVIEGLVGAGIKVFYSDLITVTQLNIPQATIDKLLKASDLQASHVLKRFGRYTSLALVAIEAKNADLASYWIDMGSPMKPDLFFNNAMDVLAKNGSAMNITQVEPLFEQLAKQGLTPYWPSSIATLKELITAQRLKPFDINKLTRVQFSKMQRIKIDSIVNDLHTKLLDQVVDFDVRGQNRHLCFDQLGIRSTKFAMSYKAKVKKLMKSRAKPDDKAVVSPRR
jgi:hypothetical protein